MARDAELDRLKVAQDLAFQRKQDAYQAQDRAWQRLSSARDTMNRAHEEKQRAYAVQDASWQEYDRVRARNGPRIDQLNAQQERAYQNMVAAFNAASAAYAARSGGAASMHAQQGRGFKAEAQACVAERRRLVDEIRSARARHETTKPDFRSAKAHFSEAKRNFDIAKVEHQQAQAAFKRAKSDFDAAASTFKKRLEVVRAQSRQRQSDKRSIAERAGVPYQYRDNVLVSREPNGTINIYFGGLGTPNGPGHGHYVLDASGTVTYRRGPYDPHGAHNFTAVAYWHKVKMSFDVDSGLYQTDNYVGIVGSTNQKSKAHIAINSDGDIVYVRDITGEVLYSRKDNIGYLPDDLDWSK